MKIKILFLLALSPHLVHAADKTWVASGASSYQANGSWSPTGMPGPNDDIVANINGSTSQFNQNAGGNPTVNSFKNLGTTTNWNLIAADGSNTYSGTYTIKTTLSNTTGYQTTFGRSATSDDNLTLVIGTGSTTGTVQVYGGTLNLGNTGTGNLLGLSVTGSGTPSTTVDAGAALNINVFNGSVGDYSLGTLTNNGIITLQNRTSAVGGAAVAQVNSLSGSSADAVIRSSGTSTNNTASTLVVTQVTSGTYAGQLIDGAAGTTSALSLTKSGAGALVLTGSSNSYSGGTTVNAGTLLLNNASGSGAGTGSVTVNGGFVGGTGSFTGALTVNSGGSLQPGASIETLGSGTLTMNDGSTFSYEVDSSALLSVGADLMKVTGDLILNGTVTLTLTDIASLPVAYSPNTTFTLINYSGAWNDGLFTYNGSTVADGGTFSDGLNIWQLDYNASTGGSNFASEYAGGSFVNITAVPEPSAVVLLGLGLGVMLYGFRSRRDLRKLKERF